MSLTPSQQYALEKAKAGKNIFVTGGGGVGKSYVASRIIEDLKEIRKNVLVTASTAKAATLINGVTCHRAFKIPLKLTWLAEPKIDSDNPVYAADTVLIDEISMLRIDAFEFVVKSIEKTNRIRAAGKDKNGRTAPVQIIVIGDFCQLPPVIVRPSNGGLDERTLMSERYGFDVGSGYAFWAPGWKRCNFETCELKEVIRQSDQETINALNQIRFGNKAALAYFEKNTRKRKFPASENVICLCGKNKTAEHINNAALARLPGQEHIYNANVVGQVTEQDKQAPDLLRLKIGAHVIMLQNTEQYQNGSNAIITKLGTNSVSVLISESGEEIEIPYTTWAIEKYVVKNDNTIEKEQIGSYAQLPMRLGYAITIHRAQGQTFDKVTLYPEIFAYGQLYVGLSRMKNIKDLHIEGILEKVDLLAAPEVINFYERSRTSNAAQLLPMTADLETSPAPTQAPNPKTESAAEQATEKAAETEDLIAIHCPKQCINTSLIFINQLILINKDDIIVNPDLETIYLPETATAYKDAICNFIKAIS